MTPPLVAVAHGSRHAAAQESTTRLLDEVRRQRPGLQVHAAYLDHADPTLLDVLQDQPDAVVVPLLLGAGHHSRIDIPAAVKATGGGARQAPVLGPDPRLLVALERHLAAVGVAPGDPSTAVVLAAAGSGHTESTGAVRRLAGAWTARGWWAVLPAFCSGPAPSVEAAVRTLREQGASRVAVASYLLSPGRFADRLTAAGADVVAAPLGSDPALAALVLDRYDVAVSSVPIPSTRLTVAGAVCPGGTEETIDEHRA